MFAQRLQRARKAAGLSMSKLAEEVGVSANAIKKYEHGINIPSSNKLLKMAKALNVRTEYFFRPVEVELQEIEYRKKSNLPKKLLNRLTADVMDQAERWSMLLDLYPDTDNPIPKFSLPAELPAEVGNLEEIEDISNQMRQAWNLGLDPIPELVTAMESKGAMIICTQVEGVNRFDGLAGRIGKIPVVVFSNLLSGDRQRFTLAHELGHLVLHDRLAKNLDEEKACNRFAGAFLLPKKAVVEIMGKHRHTIEPIELLLLKHEFGISMTAILMRLEQCGVISTNLKRQYFIEFGKLGWRQNEPGEPYPKESTFRFKQLVCRALAEEYIGESKAAELLGMSVYRFHMSRKLEDSIGVDDQRC